MGLITCEDCGKEVSERAATCPNCGAPLREEAGPETQQVVAVHPTYAAGAEAGRGCAMLLTSRAMAFIVFIAAWMFGGTYLAARTGYYVEGENTAIWVGFVILVLPFILAYVLRKPIQKVIPMIMGSGLLIVIALFFIVATLIFISMAHSFFFDWSGAQ